LAKFEESFDPDFAQTSTIFFSPAVAKKESRRDRGVENGSGFAVFEHFRKVEEKSFKMSNKVD